MDNDTKRHNEIKNSFAIAFGGIGVSTALVMGYSAMNKIDTLIGSLAQKTDLLQDVKTMQVIPFNIENAKANNIEKILEWGAARGTKNIDELELFAKNGNFRMLQGVVANPSSSEDTLDMVYNSLERVDADGNAVFNEKQQKKIMTTLASSHTLSPSLVDALTRSGDALIHKKLLDNTDAKFNKEHFQFMEMSALESLVGVKSPFSYQPLTKEGMTLSGTHEAEVNILERLAEIEGSFKQENSLLGAVSGINNLNIPITVTESNQDKISELLREGDMTIKNININDEYRNSDIFSTKDYAPVVKVGIVFNSDDIWVADSKRSSVDKLVKDAIEVSGKDRMEKSKKILDSFGGIIVTTENQKLLTELLNNEDIVIMGVDIQKNFTDEKLFKVEDYQPVLREGLVFNKLDMWEITEKGKKALASLSSSSSVRIEDKAELNKVTGNNPELNSPTSSKSRVVRR